MSSSLPTYELYRQSSIGWALAEALDELISESYFEPQTAIKILNHFDKAIQDSLQHVRARLALKGHLQTYRCCDDVWTFLLKDVVLKLEDGEQVTADRLKIVACNARKPNE
ncbi:transcription initiation factor IIA subunit gamma [Starmerella bacillaris]|uniref:Transcription initiation factor IIA subunit 2 n=1 Tax=Starmerella bacillaris TaxID=1247836 RepID=A0AAV5RM75_STABA|nr:transcription initiation factor IIA subunit gamma [Starmerella bacillaris]